MPVEKSSFRMTQFSEPRSVFWMSVAKTPHEAGWIAKGDRLSFS
jgi:hypothetical protein